MAFSVPPLPYDYGALAPTIDEQTMKLHHDKHHQAYVDNLNAGIEEAGLQDKSIEEILGSVSSASPKVRNNGGGHWNHSFFWETMTPGGGQPSGALADAIDAKFGSLDEMKTKFNAAGAGQFGSGLGLADRRRIGRTRDLLDAQSGQSADGRRQGERHAAARQRTCGSMPITSPTTTAVRIISRLGGMW